VYDRREFGGLAALFDPFASLNLADEARVTAGFAERPAVIDRWRHRAWHDRPDKLMRFGEVGWA